MIMLMQIFKNILIMSAAGSLLAIFIMCIRPVTVRLFSAKWHYYIWLTVLAVMILPVNILADVSANMPDMPAVYTAADDSHTRMDLQTGHAAGTEGDAVVPDNKMSEQSAGENMLHLAETSVVRQISRIYVPTGILEWLSIIWLAGAFIVAASKILKYHLFLKNVYKNSRPDTDIAGIPERLRVFRTDMLDAPLLVGLIRPALFLPDFENSIEDPIGTSIGTSIGRSIGISGENMRYIIMHELTHYKRRDILYKWFAMLVQSVHWFDPFVYAVSRQIDLNCEISCDIAVTEKLDDREKDSYMRMILELAAAAGRKNRSAMLTTQMAGSKKTLKRRFAMIRYNQKRYDHRRNDQSSNAGKRKNRNMNKLISAISVAAAFIMLSTTVFASSALSNITTAGATVEIVSGGKTVELAHRPFTENGDVYVPLRDVLDKFNGEYKLSWNKGTMDIVLTDKLHNIAGAYRIKIGENTMSLRQWNTNDPGAAAASAAQQFTVNMAAYPVLRNSTTYISVKDANYIMYEYLNTGVENNGYDELEYNIYSRSGKNITAEFDNAVERQREQVKMATPYGTAELFFKSFHEKDFDKMKRYCTSKCADTFFEDGSVYGMRSVSLKSMSDISSSKKLVSGAVQIEITLYTAEFDSGSAFSKGRSDTYFWMTLQKQADGTYLIDGFSTKAL